MIEVSLTNLQLCRETLERGAQALRQGMQVLMTPMESMRDQLHILSNACDVVDRIIEQNTHQPEQ